MGTVLVIGFITFLVIALFCLASAYWPGGIEEGLRRL